MNLHDSTQIRTIRTGDGARHQQRRFHCPVHGWFDLFVFPDAPARHAFCTEENEKQTGVGLEIPKILKKAA